MIKLTSVASILFGIAWLVPSRADELADPRTANLWGCWDCFRSALRGQWNMPPAGSTLARGPLQRSAGW